jgi:hypothetical protein
VPNGRPLFRWRRWKALFGRLAMAAQRGAWSGEAIDGPTAAYLLILREALHHWRMERLDLVSPSAG